MKVRCSTPPPDAAFYADRTDWWNYILSLPAPRVIVMEVMDVNDGAGSVIGEVHAHIWAALGCAGVVSNGAARDLPALAAMNFPVFAPNVAVSHAYTHVVSVGEPVKEEGSVTTWKLRVETRPGRKDIPPQRIHIDICAIPSHDAHPMMLRNLYGVAMGTITNSGPMTCRSPMRVISTQGQFKGISRLQTHTCLLLPFIVVGGL